MNQSIIQTQWRPVEQILLTRVAGILRQEQIEEWERDLEHTSRQIPKNLTFVMLVDIRGYEVSEQDRDRYSKRQKAAGRRVITSTWSFGRLDLS